MNWWLYHCSPLRALSFLISFLLPIVFPSFPFFPFLFGWMYPKRKGKKGKDGKTIGKRNEIRKLSALSGEQLTTLVNGPATLGISSAHLMA
jgi:hypothetical protein